MKQEFSKNATEVFTKTIFHYVPEILKYIDEIKDQRKRYDYSMRYLIFSEMLIFQDKNFLFVITEQYPSLFESSVIIAYNNFSFAFKSLLNKMVAGITA